MNRHVSRRLLSKHSTTRAPLQLSKLPTQQFDASSGLMFTETMIQIQDGDDQGWEYRADIPTRPKQGNLSVEIRKGARSLQDITIDCIVQHISEVTLDDLKYLPSKVLQKIWQILKSGGSVSFHAFSMFSKLLAKDNQSTLDLLRYSASIQTVKSPLDVYTKLLTSKNLEFLTSLSLTASFTVPELVKLSSVTNLAVLDIVAPQSQRLTGVSDRLIRAWHLAVKEQGAFSVLRILRLWNHQDVTAKSLEYIDIFPALAIFDVKGCNVAISATPRNKLPNWKPTLDSDVLGLLETACVERAMLMRHKLGRESKPILRLCAQPLPDCAIVDRIPRSKVSELLATPKPTLKKKSSDKSVSEDHPGPESQDDIDIKVAERRKQRKRMRKLMDTHNASEPWDFQNYTSLAKIGELRNDIDLRNAGIETRDQAMISGELINSMPVVSLRLGPTHSCLKLSSNVGSYKSIYVPLSAERFVQHSDEVRGGGNLAFVRIKVSSSNPVGGECPSGTGTVEHLERAGFVERGVKRSASHLSSKKRRKLDDVLSSFQ